MYQRVQSDRAITSYSAVATIDRRQENHTFLKPPLHPSSSSTLATLLKTKAANSSTIPLPAIKIQQHHRNNSHANNNHISAMEWEGMEFVEENDNENKDFANKKNNQQHQTDFNFVRDPNLYYIRKTIDDPFFDARVEKLGKSWGTFGISKECNSYWISTLQNRSDFISLVRMLTPDPPLNPFIHERKMQLDISRETLLREWEQKQIVPRTNIPQTNIPQTNISGCSLLLRGQRELHWEEWDANAKT